MKKVIMVLMIVLLANLLSVSQVESGPVLGPCSGEIVDAATGKPIEGALVLLYWVNEIPQIMHPEYVLVRSELQYTDAKGRYKIGPSLSEQPGYLERVQAVIYQRGYKAYIRDIQYHTPYHKPDPNFTLTGNRVVLERIAPAFDYGKHYTEIEDALRGLEWIAYGHTDQKAFLQKAEVLRRAEWERERGTAERRYR